MVIVGDFDDFNTEGLSGITTDSPSPLAEFVNEQFVIGNLRIESKQETPLKPKEGLNGAPFGNSAD